MNKRAVEEENAKRMREEAEAAEALEREARRAMELEEQIRADAERQQAERDRLFQARKRAISDATEVPAYVDEGTPIETFPEEISWEGAKFTNVKLFHPQKGSSPSPSLLYRTTTHYSHRLPRYRVAS